MTPDDLLELFDAVAAAVGDAVRRIERAVMRDRTQVAGQYALDLVADRAALELLHRAPVRVVSEESGVSGDLDSKITVVVDPVDGSTNCARGIAYWATSLCALDHDGPLAALVTNHPASIRHHAVRSGGAFRDGVPMVPSAATRVEDGVIGVSLPTREVPWKQYRALGCIALALCEVAAGGFDGYVDGRSLAAPWDYLGGLLVCREAGAEIVDADGRELVSADPAVRRNVVAAGTAQLRDVLVDATRTAWA
jgi:fructose-1,6-bisphosphatase/inositol monophosphatase family enzyme